MVYSDLERDVSIYCGQLRNKHKKQRRHVFHDGKAKLLWDLPKCAIACRRENAAKRCMLDLHDTTIAEIIFSAALDITTGEPMEPCAICKAVFDTIE